MPRHDFISRIIYPKAKWAHSATSRAPPEWFPVESWTSCAWETQEYHLSSDHIDVSQPRPTCHHPSWRQAESCSSSPYTGWQSYRICIQKLDKDGTTVHKHRTGSVFGAELFHQYFFGKHFVIESDHKPLKMITKKSLTVHPSTYNGSWCVCNVTISTYNTAQERTWHLPTALQDCQSHKKPYQTHQPAPDITISLTQFSHAKLEELRTATREDPVLSSLAQ